MRENVRDRDRLDHIIEAIDRIINFANGKSREEIEADKLQYYGVIKCIEIICEATYKLTKAFWNAHPETPWEFIAKMRHVLVHDYFLIDSREIFKVIHEDLSPLREQIARYIAETDWDAWENNVVVVKESTTHKILMQTAERMKSNGYSLTEICKITGLNRDEIENL